MPGSALWDHKALDASDGEEADALDFAGPPEKKNGGRSWGAEQRGGARWR